MTRPTARDPAPHVALRFPESAASSGLPPTSSRDWSQLHLVLAAWKARTLLDQARDQLLAAVPEVSPSEHLAAAEVAGAVEAIEHAVAHLQTITAQAPR